MVMSSGGLLFFQNVDKPVVHFLVLIKSRAFQLIDAFAAEPVSNSHYLLRLYGREFEIDCISYIPIVVNEDVALV